MNSRYYICINIPNKRNEHYFNYTTRIGMNLLQICDIVMFSGLMWSKYDLYTLIQIRNKYHKKLSNL